MLLIVCFQDVVLLMKKVFGDAEMRQADVEALASLPEPVRRPHAAPQAAEGKANGSDYASAESGDSSSDDGGDHQQPSAAVKKALAADRKRATGAKREVKCSRLTSCKLLHCWRLH